MSSADPIIDYAQIEFPSDRLTVKTLRKVIPHSFDFPARENYLHAFRQGFIKRESLENYLGGMINTEREIAALAFYAAMGMPKPEDIPGPRWEAVDALIKDYIAVGLVQGEHEGHELIRQIENQAVAQANRLLGTSPQP